MATRSASKRSPSAHGVASTSKKAKVLDDESPTKALQDGADAWDEDALIAAAEAAEQGGSVSGSAAASASTTATTSQQAAAAPVKPPPPAATKQSKLFASSSSSSFSSSSSPSLFLSDDPLALERAHMSSAWLSSLQPHLTSSPEFTSLKSYLRSQASSGATLYPPAHLVHSWSTLTPRIEDVKIVVLGQDPYHGPGQAMGLSFSVPRGVAVPGSLKNIYKELYTEYGSDFNAPTHGDLSAWARQGVLMLNSSLTVRKSEAGSHAGKGWEVLTREVLKLVAQRATGGTSGEKTTVISTKEAAKGSALAAMFKKQENKQAAPSEDGEGGEDKAPASDAAPPSTSSSDRPKGVVFLLWGLPASKTFSAAVPSSLASHPNILLLRSPHPSPLSAHRGFLGNGHFKKANEWLETKGGWGKGGGVKWAEL